ncbi:DNA polymerase subunit gamma-2, mitochondrial [Parasteatoda tepidariorum]|uniref:DNA polymerase subunit gamma-2, mitochondrial n=1 Tax=Parasteatoda tepidariorum TaxID=114398 RepID=UPI0039BD24E6
MSSGVIVNSWTKLLRMCQMNNIINTCFMNDSDRVLQYGSLGSLLKRNVFNTWLSSLINNNEVTIFPLEIVNLQQNSDFKITEKNNDAFKYIMKNFFESDSLFGHDLPLGFAAYGPCLNQFNKNIMPCQEKDFEFHLSFCFFFRLLHLLAHLFLIDIMKNFFESDSLFGHDLPLGFAAYGPCLNQFNKNIMPCQEKDFEFQKFKSWTRLCIVFFSQPKKSTHWFHYWSKQRYLWWRKFSSIPSKFSMSEVKNIEKDIQQLSLLHEFPWGHEPLESITHYESRCVESLFQDFCKTNKLKFNPDSTPSLIVCETKLDLAVLAYLSNSYAERWRKGKLKNILHLHFKIVPYKVCILLDAESSEILKRLKNLAIHLSKELQKSGILLFPTLNSKFTTSLESLFSSFDEMGVPYIIVLNETSLQSGIAGLRNRDTTLQEQVHITELTSKLVKYLKS